jgi:hypothetical protein
MTRNSQGLTITLASLLLLAASCQKDELTVVSTASPQHVCAKTVVDLDIDSLLQCGQPPPGGADINLTICECDTIAFNPVNLPPSAEFEGWVIDQGEENVHQYQLILDTITVASELWMHFDHVWPKDGTIRIIVTTEHCE